MYLVRIERTFSAAHSIVMGGVAEPVHGHNWRVEATFAGASLDADGLLVDFHAVEGALDAIVGRFHNRSLNAVAPFDRERRGLNLGEGAAMLVLESEAHARRRGLRPDLAVRGYGAACDAHHITSPHP